MKHVQLADMQPLASRFHGYALVGAHTFGQTNHFFNEPPSSYKHHNLVIWIVAFVKQPSDDGVSWASI